MYKRGLKRGLDFVIVFIVLLVIWPILLLLIIFLHFTNKGAGVFFTQDRPGKNARIFKAIKFKTMTDERDSGGNLLPDAERLTKIGKIVRSLSIDELPQLINVLKGDMALVGPRPLLPKYLPLYSEKQFRRHEVRPGITGWAQVNGRNDISWKRKFELDVWYVDHISFWLDVKIILLTIKKVFVREGINKEGNATTEAFNGHNIHQIVNSVFTSNTYILSVEGKDGYVLIDIGDIAPIKQGVQEKCGTVQALFLTHTHYDHIYGIKDLLRLYPDCTVYTSSFGKEALGSDKLNFSRYHNDPVIWMGDNVTVLHENDKVEIFPGIFVEVFETPGHDKSCLTYKVENNVFSGDSYIPGVKVIASFPNSDREDARISKERIMELTKDCSLYPGHGNIYE
jgi:lipopolysaccharide/colanic/teichoic acid biosynthesis glycosyltransferase